MEFSIPAASPTFVHIWQERCAGGWWSALPVCSVRVLFGWAGGERWGLGCLICSSVVCEIWNTSLSASPLYFSPYLHLSPLSHISHLIWRALTFFQCLCICVCLHCILQEEKWLHHSRILSRSIINGHVHKHLSVALRLCQFLCAHCRTVTVCRSLFWRANPMDC